MAVGWVGGGMETQGPIGANVSIYITKQKHLDFTCAHLLSLYLPMMFQNQTFDMVSRTLTKTTFLLFYKGIIYTAYLVIKHSIISSISVSTVTGTKKKS